MTIDCLYTFFFHIALPNTTDISSFNVAKAHPNPVGWRCLVILVRKLLLDKSVVTVFEGWCVDLYSILLLVCDFVNPH